MAPEQKEGSFLLLHEARSCCYMKRDSFLLLEEMQDSLLLLEEMQDSFLLPATHAVRAAEPRLAQGLL